MASSAVDLVRKLNAVATTVDRGKIGATTQVALVAKDIMVTEAGRSGLKPSTRLGDRPWSVGFATPKARPQTIVSYRGPVHWIEAGTKPHVIGAKLLGTRGSIAYNAGTRTSSGSTRGSFGGFMEFTNSRRGQRARSGKRALSWGVGPKAWAFHPGTRARPFWASAKSKIAVQGPAEMQRAIRSQIVKAGFGSGSGTSSIRPRSAPARAPRNQWTTTSL